VGETWILFCLANFTARFREVRRFFFDDGVKLQTIIFEVICNPSAAIRTASNCEQLLEFLDGIGG
jgi:hypothetical protein